MIINKKKVNLTALVILGNKVFPHNTIVRLDYKVTEEFCFNVGGPFKKTSYRVKYNGQAEIWIREKYLKDIKKER